MSTIKGNTIGATWGTTGSASGAALGNGVIIRASKNVDGKITELANNEDEAIAAVLHDERAELECEIATGSGTAEPTRGAPFTVGGTTGFVTGWTVNWARGEFKKITVRARKYALIS